MGYSQGSYRGSVPWWVGGLIAIIVLSRCAMGVADRAAEPPLTTKAGVEKALFANADTAPLYRTLQRTHPQEFDALTEDVTRRSREGASGAQLDDAILDFLIAAGKRHNREMLQAPSGAFGAYRAAEIRTIEALREEDADLCSTYVTQGAVRTRQTSPALAKAMIDFRVAAWEANAAGRDRPANRKISTPSADDWRMVEERMRAGDVKPASVTAFFSPAGAAHLPPPERCDLGLAYMRAVDTLPAGKADQFYAYLMSQTD